MIDTPVALFAFNRPDLTAAQMSRLAEVGPTQLFVAVDGPRTTDEADVVRQVVGSIERGLTWDAHVRWRVADRNLGCRASLETGLDWVFSQVDRAIVLEDDIEVAPAFFPFAEQALTTFEHDPRVAMISARNTLVDHSPDGRSFLALRGSVWGWATWADRWQYYRTHFTTDLDLAGSGAPLLRKVHQHLLTTRYWDHSDDWSSAWAVWCTANGWHSVIPARNLARNAGFRADAAHTSTDDDLRAAFPDVAEAQASVIAPDLLIDPDYDDLFAVLDLVVSYDQPRRWRLLAAAAAGRSDVADSVELMLAPWSYQARTLAMLRGLQRHIDSAHLDGLIEAFS